MASKSELQKIKKLAGDSGNMETTPYLVGGKVLKKSSFTKLRTSKVMYMNELLVPEAMALSKKVSQITRYRLKEETYASENFQIMNYGIGGRISTHLDSSGKLKQPREILISKVCEWTNLPKLGTV